MFGLRLILILAVVGGLIAFIGDKLGSKIGKKKLSVFGLRPYHTSVLMTVITGILIASITLVTMLLLLTVLEPQCLEWKSFRMN